MKKGRVGIVIVNYNGANYQNEALRTIYCSTYKNNEIIIVDSGSSDNSVELAKSEYPDVHFLIQNENVGVAKGNNIGIHYAFDKLDVEYVLLINNDIILDENTLENLINESDEKTVVVPKILFYCPNDVIWYAGGKMLWHRGEARHVGVHEKDVGQYDVEGYVTYSPTCCMLLHRNILEKVGDIDEKMFMYFDDVDLCVRITDAGAKIKYVPSAKMWHKVSSSSGGMESKTFVYYNFRNRLYFLDKYSKKLLFPARIYTYSKMLAKFVLSPIYKKNDKYIYKAWRDYCVGKTGRCDEW